LERAAFVRPLLDSLPTVVVLLNRERQVIVANRELLEFLGKTTDEAIVGRRLGEVLTCQNAVGLGGCGTNEGCRHCGAVLAILRSQHGERATRECRIMAGNGSDHYELRVTASPFVVQNVEFTLLAVEDQSHEKRRRALERIFFHDVANTAMAVQSFARSMTMEPVEELSDLVEELHEAVTRLVSEITYQRMLLAAENGELVVRPTEIWTLSFLRSLCKNNERSSVAVGRRINVDPETANVRMVVDTTLLGRVVTNMLINAKEACSAGEAVTAGCREEDVMLEFWVHNPSTMPREAQHQVFQRSYSTKGPGRGLGTYSIKLLSERYMGGAVSFTTSAETGTTFRARFPREV